MAGTVRTAVPAPGCAQPASTSAAAARTDAQMRAVMRTTLSGRISSGE